MTSTRLAAIGTATSASDSAVLTHDGTVQEMVRIVAIKSNAKTVVRELINPPNHYGECRRLKSNNCCRNLLGVCAYWCQLNREIEHLSARKTLAAVRQARCCLD